MRGLYKALKSITAEYTLWESIYLSDWFDPIHKIYCSIINFYNKICRMAFWAWKLRNNYDWDGQYLYEIIYLKLDRMEKEMLDKGNLAWQYETKSRIYRSLKTAKEASRRLAQGNLEDRAVTRFHDQYGYRYKGEPEHRNDLDKLFGLRHEGKILLSKEMYRKLQKSAWKEDAARIQYHKDLVFNTLSKWLDHYWD